MKKANVYAMKYHTIFYIICALVLSCNSNQKDPFHIPDNAKQLISSDSSKTWKLSRRFNNKTRMNMGDCFLSYRSTYLSNYEMHDNNGEQDDCGETLHANWSIYIDDENIPYLKLKGGNIKELMHIDKNYKFFKILNLTDSLMILEFKHKQFSTRETTIVDVFVLEGIFIEDREFHW